MPTTAQVQFAKERLLELADDFRGAAEQYAAWTSDSQAEPRRGKYRNGVLAKNAASAGKELHPILQEGQLKLPPTPKKLCEKPRGFDELGDECELFYLWWLAVVGWLETSDEIDFVRQSDPSYSSQVFRYWEPRFSIGSARSDLDDVDPHPSQWLCMSPELTRQYGQDACLQSAAAIDFLLDRIVELPITNYGHPAPVEDHQQQARQNLKPCEKIAYQQHELAVERMGVTDPTDEEVYDWLSEHREALDGDPIPSFLSWQRYVRAGRRHYRTQKNSPRAGREGRSVVRKNDQ